MPGAGGTQRLTWPWARRVAMDMILSGRISAASEALDAGLVSRVVPPEHCYAEALRIAHEMAAKPTRRPASSPRRPSSRRTRPRCGRPGVRAQAVLHALRHRGPEGRHEGVRREAQPAFKGSERTRTARTEAARRERHMTCQAARDRHRDLRRSRPPITFARSRSTGRSVQRVQRPALRPSSSRRSSSAERDRDVRRGRDHRSGKAFSSGQDLARSREAKYVPGYVPHLGEDLRQPLQPDHPAHCAKWTSPSSRPSTASPPGQGAAWRWPATCASPPSRRAFIEVFINVGLIPDSGSTFFAAAARRSWARRWSCAAPARRSIREEAERLGLVNQVVPAAEL